MSDLTENDLHILRHMLGIDDPSKPPNPYRNHYCANAGDEALERLEKLGMVRLARGPTPSLPYETYAATDAGRDAAMASARRRLASKSKRIYSRYLDVSDACPGLTFRTFLTHPDFAESRRTA